MQIRLLVICWLLGALGAWLIARFAFKLGLIDLPIDRSSHTQPIPRGAGIGILAAFVFVTLLLKLPHSFWIPITFIAMVSFLDDKLNLSSKIKLIFQFISACIVIITSTGFMNWYLLLLYVFYIVFIVGTANFYNFMDGINGIAGIVGLIGFLLLAQFAIISGAEQSMVLLSISIAAACLGFLPFNFPTAKVFMGDVGSILIGFAFASIVILLSNDFTSFITLASFLFPFYADTLTTLYIRWRKKEQLFQAHRKHLYQIFANELKYPHWLIASGYGIVQLMIGELMIFAWLKQSVIVQPLLLMALSMLFVFLTIKIRSKKV